MKSFSLPNRLFIKLLLGFWLCSSLIILAVGMLPLLQQNHDRAPMPPKLREVLSQVADELQQEPAKLNGRFLHHWSADAAWKASQFASIWSMSRDR